MSEEVTQVVIEPIVSYDLAALIDKKMKLNYSEIKIDYACIRAYHKENKKEQRYMDRIMLEEYYFAPRISLVVIYIRVKYGYHINLMHPDETQPTWIAGIYKIGRVMPVDLYDGHPQKNGLATPEEAYEGAITRFLTDILPTL